MRAGLPIAGRRPGAPRLGAHMSIAGGVDQAVRRGARVGCEALQIFTANNTQWRGRLLPEGEVAAFRAALRATGIGPVVSHANYLINLATRDRALGRRSRAAFREELRRAEVLQIPYVVLHPGSHGGAGESDGLQRVATALAEILDDPRPARSGGPRVLLETTAGQGTALGYRFEHLARLRELLGGAAGLGVCLDTCHVFAAGYDVRTPRDVARTLAAFDAVVGLRHLKALHLNDSRRELGSRVDRHEHIGRGRIGLTGFAAFLRHRRLRGLPMLLETPKGTDFVRADRRNLRVLRRLRDGGNDV